jgi:hypothetical protein
MPPHSGNCDAVIESWFLNAKRDLLCSPTIAPRLPSHQSLAIPQCQKLPDLNVQQCGPVHNFNPKIHVPSKTTTKANRHVSFAPKDKIYEIPSIRDLSSAEFRAIYMSRQEMGKIHEECWRLVDLMNNGIEYEDQAGFSKRGLVDLKDDSVERRRKMRDQAYRIVFGVQKFHAGTRRPQDCFDVTEVMASLYSKAATQAQEDAQEAAWFDAIAVRM